MATNYFHINFNMITYTSFKYLIFLKEFQKENNFRCLILSKLAAGTYDMYSMLPKQSIGFKHNYSH